MALKGDKLLATGLLLKDAYVKITNISGNKTRLFVTVSFYLSKEAADNNLERFEDFCFNFAPSGEERWDKQAYEYLKTIDGFAEMEDC